MDDVTRKRLLETLRQFRDPAVSDFEIAFRLLRLNVGTTDPELGEAFEVAYEAVRSRMGRK